ncbi:hypothetical protein JX265_005271 [Neoarthrinium moseri]|uniref:Septation initiation network scaffold protein cdc11 n=1 Tax=Neoarthrinium moseri TaxID=1658444 RepID=A0A9P9WPJ9_9PEZI|nr:hypothetical protein JX265_005271 [Neoarthrinium moseri]
MSHAWLDSLSEDWVSQPRSDTSQAQLPGPSVAHENTRPGKAPESASRIPRLSSSPRKSLPVTSDVLSERSSNQVNIPLSQRVASKASAESAASQRGRHLSRSFSASTTEGSVLHNTVHHKSLSASPAKLRDSIPEWRRRLIYNERAYGEAKDLFSSAGTGLENMFYPPPPPEDQDLSNEGPTAHDMTLPSSPPPYLSSRRKKVMSGEAFDQSHDDFSEINPAPHGRQMRYKLHAEAQDTLGDSSRPDESTEESRGRAPQESTQDQNRSSYTSVTAKHLFDASRKTSGKSDVRHEDFSPIFIGRHSNEDGRVSFAPVELSPDQLKRRLDKLRHNQMFLDSDSVNQDESASAGAHEEDSRIQDSTEEYARQGAFLNLNRGGLSAEGSFRHRPLSPPLPTDTSEMLPESSLQASTPKQFPGTAKGTLRTNAPPEPTFRFPSLSPDLPRVPNPSPEKRPLSSGSALKLFGPYDTFTNQTLLRRISQFEDPMTESPSRSFDDPAQRPREEPPSKSEFNRGSATDSSPRRSPNVSRGHHETFGAINRFGAGELDDYVFSEDITLDPSERSKLADKENVAPDGGSPAPSRMIKFDLSHRSSFSESDPLQVRRRRGRSSTLASSSRQSASGFASRPQSSSNMGSAGLTRMATPKRDGSEGKRPRTSPSKDPTPKRRRTLHRSDIAFGLEEHPAAIEAVQTSHYQMQTGLEWRHKDLLQGQIHQLIHPAVMAHREVQRPRTPTPSQRSSVQREREPLGDLYLTAGQELESASVDDSEIFMQDFAIDGSRKTSIKTQDFLDEAEKIMGMIRSRARLPQTGLASVEESEAEQSEQRKSTTPESPIEESFEESFEEPFLRPPSRDGRPVPRVIVRQEDPELASRLKQYEEVSDMGDLITYSMRSMGLARDAIQEVNKIKQSVQQSIRNSEMRHSSSDGGEVISDLPNVVLSRNPDAPDTGEEGPIASHGSHSSNSSSGGSVPTGSSRGSDSRRLIGPDAVSQLIGDQVGNMVLDKDKNMWMKMRTPRPVIRMTSILPSEDSEDDPFASIPDLSVDVTKEKQHLALKTAPLEDLEEYVKEDFPHPPSSGRKTYATEQSFEGRSILSHTKSSFATLKQTMSETDADRTDEVEHEITIHEDRVQKSSPSRKRNLTITFSSPVASIIQDVFPLQSESGTTDDDSALERSVGDIAADSLKRGRHARVDRTFSTRSEQSRSRSRSKSTGRNLSVKGPAFVPRPVSRIDEQDEDSYIDFSALDQRQLSIRGESSMVASQDEEKRRASVSIIISTPAPARHVSHGSATPIIAQHVGTLSLSPLSDFTMNHGDQSHALEVSYVVGDDYLVTGDGSKRIMSQAIRNLVEKITEVEPFEPDWDAMQVLDINNKQLKSLHKLDEFCGSVVSLDASNNCISHLDGVPESVRNLRITNNHLSELTAWGHLMNLQYVDISNNQINSLYAFKELVHLRSLRADNNQITNLDGIKFHDSLQVLRVRGNLIEDVDFEGTKLHRLTELDLRGNQISSIEHLEQLPCLSTLNLENNRLTSFTTTTKTSMASLKYLKLSNNMITELDLAAFPSVRMLHADRNHLATLKGFSKARRLDSLSLREQRGDTPLDVSFLTSAYEVRKLFLSGNLLSAFEPKVDFLNLQYLELANCGLQSLAADLGQLMPNLRTLNLNFNAIEDLSALRYIPRLKKLLVAGNRLKDIRAVCAVLGEFPHMNKLDLRDNPTTLGFYPPVQTLVSVDTEAEFDPFTLPDAGKERDELFSKRLDMGTKQKRRFYEIAMTQCCCRLKLLDGLAIDRKEVRRRDGVWQALVEQGMVSEAAQSKEGPTPAQAS